MGSKFYENSEKTIVIDEDGNQKETTVTKTKKVDIYNEPDYIKIYTDMWCTFNQIPQRWRELFLQLALRMSYSDSTNQGTIERSQTVLVYGLIGKEISAACGWSPDDRSNLRRGLKALCDCGAIRHIDRSVYQINPSYAGKGEWKYNPRLQRGGIENIIATFNMKDKTVNSRIIWGDDGRDTDTNRFYRTMLNSGINDNTSLRTTSMRLSEPHTATSEPQAEHPQG